MHIETDDLTRPQVHALLQEHLDNMYQLSPPENVFALDLSRLRVPQITFWTVWEGDASSKGGSLLGCGALKALSVTQGEIKSMRTPSAARGRGAARLLLNHIIAVARQRGYRTLHLETGSHPDFGPAHSLYRSAGFELSGPFGDYVEDPHSVFMQLRLPEGTGDQ
jgi:putative acetyltransferase